MVGSLSSVLCCQGGLNKTKAEDDEFFNLKPIQPLAFKKNIDEAWTNETRLSYAGYYYLLGEYLSLERNSNDAENMLDLANELDPNEFLALKVVSAKISSGKNEEATSQLRKLILLYPKNAKFHYLYGSLLAKFSNFEKSIEELEKAIALDPTDESAYMQLVTIYQQQNHPELSLQVCKRLTQANARSVIGWLALARLFIDAGKHQEALAPAARAYQLNSKNPETILLYALALEQAAKKNQAIDLYDELFSENPSLEDLLAKTVALYKTFGDLNEIYERLLAMSTHSQGKSVGIEIQKALILWELNKNLDALNVLLALHEKYPESVQTLYLAALAYEKVGDFPNALFLYGDVAEDSSFYLPASFQTLRILEVQKRFDKVFAALRNLTKSRYVISEVFSLGANLYAKENNYEEAIRLLREGFQKFPDQVQLLFLVGVFQEKLGRIDDCIQTMKDVIHTNPNYSSALNYLGYIWAERGVKLDLAKILIERALSLKPDDGFYLDSLGWVYYQKGEFEKALECLARAAKSEPEEGVIIEHIGDVLLKSGKKDEAQKIFEEALNKKTLEPKDKARIEGKLKLLKNRKEA